MAWISQNNVRAKLPMKTLNYLTLSLQWMRRITNDVVALTKAKAKSKSEADHELFEPGKNIRFLILL